MAAAAPRGARIAALTIREGGPDDVPAILRLFDEAIEWMVAHGQTGQWGDRPFSERPQNVERAEEWAKRAGLRIAELDGEPEVYLQALVTSRARAGKDVGGALVRRAFDEAGDRLVRVDCWAGAPRLVQWYEEQGFTKTETFTVGEWRGQVFERRAG